MEKIMSSNRKLEEIVEKYYPEMLAFCISKVNCTDALDITQEVFVKLTEAFPETRIKDLRAWLYTVMRNTIADYFRKKNSESGLIEPYDDDIPMEEEETLDGMSEDADLELIAEKIIGSLSPGELRMYNYRYKDRLSYDKIAGLEDITPETARKRAERLRKKITGIVKRICK